MGFDDINWAQMTMPMLTTIHQNAAEKGRIAAECMIERLEGIPSAFQNRALPVQLIVRDSAGKPPKA